MRLLILAPAMLLLPAASSAAPADQPAPAPYHSAQVLDLTGGTRADCPPISRYHASQRGQRAEAKRLNELPMADHYKAVYRRIDGCEAPVLVSFGIGER